MSLQISEACKHPSSIIFKIHHLIYNTMVKLQNVNDEEKNLKSNQSRYPKNKKQKKVQLDLHQSCHQSSQMSMGNKWHLYAAKRNNPHPRILYPGKFLFHTESETDISNQQILGVYHSMTLPKRSTVGFTSVS